MRKNTHPFLKETLIQCKDGSVYLKNWLYFRTYLPLEIDFSTNKIWAIKKKEKASFSSMEVLKATEIIKKTKLK